MPIKVVISGASGLLGRAIYKELSESCLFEAIGLAYSRVSGGLHKLDITNDADVETFITKVKPKFIVHAAAERRPDVVEKQVESTHQLNIKATKTICRAAGRVGAAVLFISTDYVFDGTSPPYKENDTPKPLNTYGKSKLEGERLVLQSTQEGVSANMVLRVPILYGDIENLQESAVTCLVSNLLNRTTASVVSHYEIRYPTFTGDVAHVIRQLLEKKALDESLSGIFHYSGAEPMTKYDMVVCMSSVFNLPHDHIRPDSAPSTGTNRPFDAHLIDTGKLTALGINVQTPFKQVIKQVLAEYVTNKS